MEAEILSKSCYPLSSSLTSAENVTRCFLELGNGQHSLKTKSTDFWKGNVNFDKKRSQ